MRWLAHAHDQCFVCFDRKKTDLPLGCKTDGFLPSAFNIATSHEAKYTEGRGLSTLTPLYVISTR